MFLIEEAASTTFRKKELDLMIDGFKHLNSFNKKLDSHQSMISLERQLVMMNYKSNN